MKKRTSLPLAVALLLLLPASGKALESGLEEGQLFPDLRLPTLDGEERISISSFRGKKVLLHIFASW